MSRFFATGDSDSSSENDAGKDRSEEDSDARPEQPAAAGRRYNVYGDDSSEEDQKRIVKSERQKRLEGFETVLKQIQNAVKINDWTKISEAYEALMKQKEKAKAFIAKEGVPKIFYRGVVLVDDAVNKAIEDKDAVKKMKGNNAKALTKVKSAIKKYLKTVQAEVDVYKANPDEEDEDEADGGKDDDDDDDDDDDGGFFTKSKPAAPVAAAPKKGGKPPPKPVEEDDDEDDDDDDEDEPPRKDDEWSSEDHGDDVAQPDASEQRRNRWLKQDADSEEEKTTRKQERAKKADGKTEPPKVLPAPPKKRKEDEAKELTADMVPEALEEIVKARGRKGMNAQQLTEQLRALAAVTPVPARRIEALLLLVSLQFDVNPNNMFAFLPVDLWLSIHASLVEILNILDKNPNIVVDPTHEGFLERQPEETKPGQKPVELSRLRDSTIRISGPLRANVERLDDEYTKSLQHFDPMENEYLLRLDDEQKVVEVAERVYNFAAKWGFVDDVTRLAIRRIEHAYYQRPDQQDPAASAANDKLVNELVVYVYKHARDNDPLRPRAMLYHIYHHAVMGRFFAARDLLLMSHLQDSVQHADVPTQIRYNRAMVQLGLCAFRQGLVSEAHSCLQEICSSQRIRELLAQGVSMTPKHAQTERDLERVEREKKEKRRLLPFHMHISVDLIDAVYCTCAMLLEIPHMAANAHETKRNVISKHFRRYFYERGPFTGPPETSRDHIITGARKLARGDWKGCRDEIIPLSCWRLLDNADDVRAMLTRQIQEEGLRTYLFANSTYYDSLRLADLSVMFDLPESAVHAIVSKKMISEELHASWDQPTAAMVIHSVELTPLQFLALQWAEKAVVMVENNEKILETRSPGVFPMYNTTRTGGSGGGAAGGSGGGAGGESRGTRPPTGGQGRGRPDSRRE